MEEFKYLPPKFSYAVKDLAKFFEVFEQTGPLSSMSKNSSEKSFQSNRKHENSTQRSSHSLKTIKESLGKKSTFKGRIRHQSSINRRRRKHSSKVLPPLTKKSLTRSRSRSRSKSKAKSRENSKTKPPRYRKIRSKILYAAEKRGFRIQNNSPTAMNQTLSHLKSPVNLDSSQLRESSKILVSDRMDTRKSVDHRPQVFASSNNDIPEYMDRYAVAKSSAHDPNRQSYQSVVHRRAMKSEYGINQKLNLNININYSPSQEKLLRERNSNRAKIMMNKVRVDKAIHSFVPDLGYGTRKHKRKDETAYSANDKYNDRLER